MKRVSRRGFIAGLSALVAAPAVAAKILREPVEIVPTEDPALQPEPEVELGPGFPEVARGDAGWPDFPEMYVSSRECRNGMLEFRAQSMVCGAAYVFTDLVESRFRFSPTGMSADRVHEHRFRRVAHKRMRQTERALLLKGGRIRRRSDVESHTFFLRGLFGARAGRK